MNRRGLHKQQAGRNVDTPISWKYADAAEREGATAFKPLDVGRYAWQEDTQSIWMLIDDDPITWKQVGGTSIYSEFDHSEYGDNIISNGDMVSDLSDWIIQATPTGTVTTTGSDNEVNGTGTNFLDCFMDGDDIKINGVTKVIQRVISDTLLTTTTNFGANTDETFQVVGGWSWDNGKAKHVAGNTMPIAQALTNLSVNDPYIVEFDMTATKGYVTKVYLDSSLDGLADRVIYAITYIANGFIPNAENDTLAVYVTKDFAGSLSNFRMRKLTSRPSASRLLTSDGTVYTEFRTGPPGSNNLIIGTGSHPIQPNSTGYAAVRQIGCTNTVLGSNSMTKNIVGGMNFAMGSGVMRDMIGGTGNYGIGMYTFYNLKKGSNNIGIGASCMVSMFRGTGNIGIGLNPVSSIRANDHNIGIGTLALGMLYGGDSNIAIGNQAMNGGYYGDNNTAIGQFSLYDVGGNRSKWINKFTDYSVTVPGTVKVECNNHGFSTSDQVRILGSRYYDGTFSITKIDNNNFYIDTRYFVDELRGATTPFWAHPANVAQNNVGIGSNTGRGIKYGSGNTIIGSDITGLNENLTNNILLGSGGSVRLQFDGTQWVIPNLNIQLGTGAGTKIGTAPEQKLGFYGATPVIQPDPLTEAKDTISFTAPGTPDYDLTGVTNSSPYGFDSEDTINTLLSVVANLQARVNELETKLQTLGFLGAA